MLRTSLAAAAALAITMPASAEVVESSADHFVTRDSVTVKAPPKAAWLALIEPGGWWASSHSWSGDAKNMMLIPQGGGCFCERLPEKDAAGEVGLAGSAQHMTVLMAQPMKVLRMRGGLGPLQSEPVDGVLTVTLQPDKAGGGTKIVWEYAVAGHMRFEVPKISKAVDGVMSEQLGRLADLLGRASPAAAPASKLTTGATPAAKPADAPAPPPKPRAGPATAPTSQDVGAALDAMDNKRGPGKKPD